LHQVAGQVPQYHADNLMQYFRLLRLEGDLRIVGQRYGYFNHVYT